MASAASSSPKVQNVVLSMSKEETNYYREVAWKAAKDCGESILYAVLIEFLALHKIPKFRFILYPQMSLKWKPNNPRDRRQEITDLGVVNFTPSGYKLRCGVEAKRATPVMAELPNARYLKSNTEVQEAFHVAMDQATDQAKAAFKNDFFFDPKLSTYWMLVVGPYWTPVELGPFSKADLTVRSHKKSSSEDFMARMELEEQESQLLVLKELYCFNSQSSFDCIEGILKETDDAAQPLIDLILGRLDSDSDIVLRKGRIYMDIIEVSIGI